MTHKDFGEHEFHCVHSWVKVIREGIETHVFEDIEEKEDWEEVAVEYDSLKTPILETTRKDINDLLEDGHEADNDRLPSSDTKPRVIDEYYQLVYKERLK